MLCVCVCVGWLFAGTTPFRIHRNKYHFKTYAMGDGWFNGIGKIHTHFVGTCCYRFVLLALFVRNLLFLWIDCEAAVFFFFTPICLQVKLLVVWFSIAWYVENPVMQSTLLYYGMIIKKKKNRAENDKNWFLLLD